MENNQLLGAMQAFIAVVESGSFSACARRLGLSQPTISRQINTLEEQLGVRLLQRTTRRLSLTEAGQIYYEKARQIQLDVVEAGLSISGFKEKPSGVLRISAPYTWTETLIAPYISEFLQKYPDIVLDIECNDQFQDIIEERLDVVVRVGVLKDSSFVAVPFATINLIFCATPAYLAQYGTPSTAEELQNHNFILFEDYHQLMVTQGESMQIVNVSGNLKANTVPVMLAAVRQHMGITVLPGLFVNQLLQTGELVEVLSGVKVELKNLPIHHVFALYSNRKHLSAKVRAFLDFFRCRIKQNNAEDI